jgi:hypothetical protein
MSTRTKIALAVVLALGATSAALAQDTAQKSHASAKHMTAPVANARASGVRTPRIALDPPGAMIQDDLYRASNGFGFSPVAAW